MPRLFNIEVVLPDMHARSSCQERNVRPVVHKERHAMRPQRFRQFTAGFEVSARWRRLIPVLEQTHSSLGQAHGAISFGGSNQPSV
jgi:hypothetical protein